MILLYFNAFIMTISAPLRSHKRKNAKLTGRFLRFAPVTMAPLKYSKKGLKLNKWSISIRYIEVRPNAPPGPKLIFLFVSL